MTTLTRAMRRSVAACTLAVAAMAPLAASAAPIQLGFILDRSGSIGGGNWTTIVNGLASAISLIPADGTYEVSVVTFQSAATIDVNSFVINNAVDAATLAGLIMAIPFSGGGTNFAPAFTLMQTALTDAVGTVGFTTAANAQASYVNFATDGQQGDVAAGQAARNALIAAGIDNISVEGIGGGVDAGDLQNNYCFPGPCDTTIPFNFPAQGFYVGVADATAYAAAIGNKIRVVTGQVPEPTTALLVGAALLALGASRRRKTIAAV